MDETSPRELRGVRDLLERATVPEPPIGPMAQNALRAGLRLRRRRQAQGAAVAAAAVPVIAAAALAVAGAVGHRAATPANRMATVYVLGGTVTRGTVTPISTVTNTPGKPIVVRSGNMVISGDGVSNDGVDMVVTPNGKTIWVSDGSGTVTPISTATKTAGKPITVVHQHRQATEQIVITPDGKTVYVLDSSGAVTPISTATNTPGVPIELRRESGRAYEYRMAITPDGRTLYVDALSLTGPSYVIPIATATNTPGQRIRIETAGAGDIVVTPDGKTAYVVGLVLTPGPAPKIVVTPIATATNTPGKPISTGTNAFLGPQQVVMTPDGRTIYILTFDPNGVIPFSTATNRPSRVIRFGAPAVRAIAITPDGHTAYAINSVGIPQNDVVGGNGDFFRCLGPPGAVTPIATATSTPGKPIKIGCGPWAIAITPDGKTAYVDTRSGAVTPITTATGRPGKPIKVEGDGPVALVIGP